MTSEKLMKGSVFIGGIITLGFGVYHFLVPSLYWAGYMTSLPDELVRAILATNFFLSLSLSILGAFTLIIARRWTNDKLTRLWVWIMSGLWVVRAAYQVVYPQGQLIPGLAVIMEVLFILTALCFLIPAMTMGWRSRKKSKPAVLKDRPDT